MWFPGVVAANPWLCNQRLRPSRASYWHHSPRRQPSSLNCRTRIDVASVERDWFNDMRCNLNQPIQHGNTVLSTGGPPQQWDIQRRPSLLPDLSRKHAFTPPDPILLANCCTNPRAARTSRWAETCTERAPRLSVTLTTFGTSGTTTSGPPPQPQPPRSANLLHAFSVRNAFIFTVGCNAEKPVDWAHHTCCPQRA